MRELLNGLPLKGSYTELLNPEVWKLVVSFLDQGGRYEKNPHRTVPRSAPSVPYMHTQSAGSSPTSAGPLSIIGSMRGVAMPSSRHCR